MVGGSCLSDDALLVVGLRLVGTDAAGRTGPPRFAEISSQGIDVQSRSAYGYHVGRKGGNSPGDPLSPVEARKVTPW